LAVALDRRGAVSPRGSRYEPLKAGQRRQDRLVATLEQLTPGGVDGLGVLEVLLQKLAHIPGVDARGLQSRHLDGLAVG
jgi:hypothetical protein